MTLPRARIWLALVISRIGAALSAAPTQEAPRPEAAVSPGSAAYPLTAIDDGKVAVTLARKPTRIVSVTLFTDEVLLDLVGPGRLAAVTTFAPDAAISNVAKAAEAVPAKVALAVEPVLALNPDLVLVADWSDAAVVKQLREAGIAVYLTAAARTIPEIRAKIRAVATLVGETAKGDEMIGAMDARLAEVARRVAIPADRRLRVVDYAVWGAAMGAGSSWDEIVKAAGLVNAVGSIQADQYGQVPLSKEKLVELDPDLLILPGWVYGDPQGADAFARQVREDPALKNMKSLRAGALHQMPERLKSTVSQYVAEAVEFLARTAYPDLFR